MKIRQELPIDLLPKLLYTIGNITGNITGIFIYPDNKPFIYPNHIKEGARNHN
jgi:hypothetical protein